MYVHVALTAVHACWFDDIAYMLFVDSIGTVSQHATGV